MSEEQKHTQETLGDTPVEALAERPVEAPTEDPVEPPVEPSAEPSTGPPEQPSDVAPEQKQRKLVGFAPEPEEDLKEHHKYLDERKADRFKSNPFSKIPPELAYLEPRSEGPRPLPHLQNPFQPSHKPKSIDEVRDRRALPIKELSVANKQTELNFNYYEIWLPVASDKVLVDVKYVSLTSLDFAKINRYPINLSNQYVGLGHTFVGTVVKAGSRVESVELAPGSVVFGSVNPQERKGSMQSTLIVNPARDVLIPVPQETLEQLSNVNVKLSFSPLSSFLVADGDVSDLSLESELAETVGSEDYGDSFHIDSLAKLSVFPSSYCRAKQALTLMDGVFANQRSANIIINGGDTDLGYTLVQTLLSSLYSDVLERLNVVLVVQDASVEKVRNFVGRCGGNTAFRKVHVVAYDVKNEDLKLPGEKLPVVYKKPSLFAADMLGAMFEALPADEKVTSQNVTLVKADLFVDVVGSKKMFQHSVAMKELDEVNFPFKQKILPGAALQQIFGGRKGPLFEKLLKPKMNGATFVSFCRFYADEPSYLIDKLHDYSNSDMFSPFSLKWTQGLANLFVSGYNYYERLDLEVKKLWIQEGLRLLLKGELKFNVSEVTDWRNNFRKYMSTLRQHDDHYVFEIEKF